MEYLRSKAHGTAILECELDKGLPRGTAQPNTIKIDAGVSNFSFASDSGH